MTTTSSLAYKRSESVSVPDHGRFLDGTAHVVVGKAQLVGERLDLVGRGADAVVNDGVPGGRGHALAGCHGDQVELVDVPVDDVGIDDGSWQWVLEASRLSSEEAGVHSLTGVDVHQLGGVSKSSGGECLLDLVDLSSADTLNLALTDSVSVEDDLSRVGTVGTLEGFASRGHTCAERVGGFLSDVVLDYAGGPVRGGRVVHGGTQCKNRLLSEAGCVEDVQAADHSGFVHERQVVDGPRNSSQLRTHLDQNLRDDGTKVLSFRNGVREDDL